MQRDLTALREEFFARLLRSVAASPPDEQPVSLARVVIEVRADGRLSIRSWYGAKVDAMYAPCTVEEALRRQLPEVLGEAVAYVELLSSPKGETQRAA